MAIKTKDFLLAKFVANKLEEIRRPLNEDGGVVQPVPQCNPTEGGVTDPLDIKFIRAVTWFALDLYHW